MAIHYGSAVMKMVVNEETPPLVKIQDCKDGKFCYFPHDFYIGGSLERYGEYVGDESEFMLQYIKEGDRVVEVGANIGCHTVAFAKAVGPTGQVFAFEPQRIIFQMLCANLALNAIWNVHTAHMGLGTAERTACVYPFDYAKGNNFGGGMIVPEGGEPVQIMPLDRFNLARCDFIKIDVEGMEAEVLRGARGVISQHRPIIYMENDREEKKKTLIDMMRVMNYDLYWHIPPLFRVNNWRNNPVNDYGNIVSINMLCLPKEKNIPAPKGLTRIANAGVLE